MKNEFGITPESSENKEKITPENFEEKILSSLKWKLNSFLWWRWKINFKISEEKTLLFHLRLTLFIYQSIGLKVLLKIKKKIMMGWWMNIL